MTKTRGGKTASKPAVRNLRTANKPRPDMGRTLLTYELSDKQHHRVVKKRPTGRVRLTVCDLETSKIRRHRPKLGCCATPLPPPGPKKSGFPFKMNILCSQIDKDTSSALRACQPPSLPLLTTFLRYNIHTTYTAVRTATTWREPMYILLDFMLIQGYKANQHHRTHSAVRNLPVTRPTCTKACMALQKF